MKASIMVVLLAVVTSSASSCSSLPKQPASDPPNTPRNASTSQWFGQSSNGSHSLVRQVSTGINRYRFSETWFAGGKIIATEGNGYFEPSTNTNVYNYTKPEGIVVVQTNESATNNSTRDQVLNSTLPSLFKPGDTITYYPRDRAPRAKLMQLE